jgi:hypothetical protein
MDSIAPFVFPIIGLALWLLFVLLARWLWETGDCACRAPMTLVSLVARGVEVGEDKGCGRRSWRDG